MTNYSAIADACTAAGFTDPTQWEAAFNVLAAETEIREDAEKRVTEVDVLAAFGMTSGDSLLSRLEAALPARVARLFEPANGGIKILDPETVAVLGQLVAGAVITQAESDGLQDIARETVPVWQGLKPGHCQNAMQWRSAGKI